MSSQSTPIISTPPTPIPIITKNSTASNPTNMKAPPNQNREGGIIKMLLQSATTATASSTTTTVPCTSTSTPVASILSPSMPSPRELAAKMPPIDIVEENASSFVHLISSTEKINGLIGVDHPYARNFNWRPDYSCTAKPAKVL